MKINLPGVGYLEAVVRRPKQKPDRINELSKYITIAEQALRDRHTDWKQYDEYYVGLQAINKGLDLGSTSTKTNIDQTFRKRNENRDKRPFNLITPTVETMIPILRDAAPMWYYLYEGWDEVGPTLAQEVTNYCQGYWYHAKMDHVLEEILRDMVVYGTGFIKVYWDPTIKPVLKSSIEVEFGEFDEEITIAEKVERELIGDAAIEWCDPYSVYPDPTARRMDECRFVALRVEVTKSALERLFPKADKDGWRPVSADTTERLMPTEQTFDRAEMVEVWEIYHEHGEQLTIFSGNEILYDEESPVPNNSFPVVPFVNRRRGGHFWGHSEVGDLIDDQDAINLVNYRIAHNQRVAGQMQRKTNIPGLKSVTNDYGAIHYTRARVGNEAGYLDWDIPPEVPQSAFVYLELRKKQLEDLSGIHAVTQGIKPKGVTSGIAIAQLSEAAQARLRLMISSTAISLQQVGQLLVDVIQENYAEPRSIAFMGDEGPIQADMAVETLNPLTGGAMYRCIVQTKGELPLSPAARLDIASQLARDGVLDAEEVLKIAKWPNWQDVVQRKAQAQMAQMQGQQAGQMAAQGGMAPGGQQSLEQLFSPEELEALAQMTPEEQEQIIQAAMQQGATA